jgi:signal transduction histidine kinase
VRRVLLGFLLVVSAIFVLAALYYKAVPDKGKVWIIVGGAAIVTGLALYRLLFIRLYEQADRAKRLALIGTMAAGVAHEIKNPLAAIKGAAQFVQKELEGVEGKVEARDYLNLLVDEVDRLNGVIESFLTYARPLEPRRQDVPLQDLLADVVKLQAPSLPAAIRIETAFDRDLPPAWADPVLVRHAVTNVMRNGIEAMGQEGRLAVRTRPVVTALRSYAAVEVEDTGPGIPRDDLERIFQPFYTTKSKGTGLGLAIALRIAEAHGGEIGVENVAPHGCRFTILLPVRTL